MGSLCSKRGAHTSQDEYLPAGGQIHRVQSRPAPPSQRPARSRPAKPPQAHTLGGPTDDAPPDPRAAAAEAAEQRLKSAQKRGVVSSNPNRGKLAAQLEASKAAPRIPEPRQEEELVWD